MTTRSTGRGGATPRGGRTDARRGRGGGRGIDDNDDEKGIQMHSKVFWVLTTFQTPTVNAPECSASTIVRVVTTYLAHRPGVVAGNVAERAGSDVFVVFFTNFLFPVHYYLQRFASFPATTPGRGAKCVVTALTIIEAKRSGALTVGV
ncbi:hypothetical protein Tco_0369764 [Tanacetum coccineum]